MFGIGKNKYNQLAKMPGADMPLSDNHYTNRRINDLEDKLSALCNHLKVGIVRTEGYEVVSFKNGENNFNKERIQDE